MIAVAALLDSRAATGALRRTLPAEVARVIACRTMPGLLRVLEARLIDAVVLAPSPALLPDLETLRRNLPAIPVVGYAHLRADDGELLVACRRLGVAVAVAGVDDAVIGEIVMRHSLTSARRRALADAPRLLRLSEPIQRAAWEVLVREVEQPIRTRALAGRLGVSREHLSRQFGAGGAPNLKRVIDLTRIACAAQLLQNPGYTLSTVVRLLHFTSSGHLASTSRRVTGLAPAALGARGPRGVLEAFVRERRMRSRA